MENISEQPGSSSSARMDSESRQAVSSKKTITPKKIEQKKCTPEIPVSRRHICFVMSTFIDNEGRHPDNQSELQKYQSLKKYYRDELFKGILFSLHDNFRLVEPAVKDSEGAAIGYFDERSEIYIRDPVVFLTCKNKHLALYSAYYEKETLAIFNAVHAIPSCPEIVKIEIDARVDGGNVIYSPSKCLLLHGNNLGAAFKDGDPKCTLATEKLEEKMLTLGVRVLGLNPNVHFYRMAIKRTFFHLDCFMHQLPDGRLLIMNNKLLRSDSFELLKKEWGDSLIDLGLPLIDLKKIPPMNLLSFESKEGTIIICNNLYEVLLKSLTTYGKVITIQNLDSRSSRYDAKLSQSVAEYLTHEGFIGVNPFTLLQTLPLRRDYLVRVDKDYQRFDQSHYSKVPDFVGGLDSALSQSTLDFKVEDGGPHCLTQEIIITQA
ncbi:hypothetical protein [Kistimonas asteriae]|uniref:hypothetical protein n=1 Tax=Kistimonas asteriae TaxID=517724 RepID=UPI001BABB7EA|nr:hypothetical protein [Kistimonas asteriae]